MSRLRRRSGEYLFNDWSGPLEGLAGWVAAVEEQACRKFGVDHDGDCPVNLIVIDRTRFEPMHYVPVPYTHSIKTVEDFDTIEKALLRNLDQAMADYKRFRDIQELRKRSGNR